MAKLSAVNRPFTVRICVPEPNQGVTVLSFTFFPSHPTKIKGTKMKPIIVLLTLAICSCQPIDGYQDYYIWEQIGG